MSGTPVILDSARRHGVNDQDIIHAYFHPIRVLRLDDLVMLIGPDRSARLLEIGVASTRDTDVIVHAMPARQKFTR